MKQVHALLVKLYPGHAVTGIGRLVHHADLIIQSCLDRFYINAKGTFDIGIAIIKRTIKKCCGRCISILNAKASFFL